MDLLKIKAVVFVVYFRLSYFMFSPLFLMLTQKLLLICRTPKGQTQSSLGLHKSGTHTHQLAFCRTSAHTRDTDACTGAGSLANNAALSSFIRSMHRCRACSPLMKNNLSKSVVALRQPFSSKCHLQRGTPCSSIIVLRQRSPEIAWGS